MSMIQPTPDPRDEAGRSIELEPPAGPPPQPEGEFATLKSEGEPPIPQRPLHLCPNCDYNLTGLISRRCPECGEPFTLMDARDHGFELSESGRQFRRWIRADRAVLILGIGLLAFGLCCPCITHDRALGTWSFAPSIKTWAMWMVLVPLVGLLLLVNLYYEQSWSRILLEVGIAVLIIGFLVFLL
jgi:hypothetical protein